MLKANLLKRWDGFTLRAQFEMPTPGVVALFGRSGCGKSTLVNLVSGLLPPDEGFVQLDDTVLTDTRAGVSVPVERRRIGYVFQEARLFPHFSVLGNLRYGHKRAGRVPQVIGFDEIVTLLGIERLLDRRPHALSGGERQRVALGRALLSQPRLLLLDEPLAALDVARRDEVLPYLEALRDRLSIPMIYVSHQFDEVLRLATHVVLLESGSVVAQGSINEISLRPELRAIVGADAVGAVVDGVVESVDAARGMADLRLGVGAGSGAAPTGPATLHVSLRGARVGARLRVQLLARDIILATERPHALSVRNALEGTVVNLADETKDDSVMVHVKVGDATILSRVTRGAVDDLGLRAGQRIWVLVKAVSTRGHAVQFGSGKEPLRALAERP
jgi:molybdate transport system ATP-binding protein